MRLQQTLVFGAALVAAADRLAPADAATVETPGHSIKAGVESVYWQGTNLDREEKTATWLSLHGRLIRGLGVEGKAWSCEDPRAQTSAISVRHSRQGLLAGLEYAIPWYLRWSFGLGIETIMTTARTVFDHGEQSVRETQTYGERAIVARFGVDYAVYGPVEVTLNFGRRFRQESGRTDVLFNLGLGFSL